MKLSKINVLVSLISLTISLSALETPNIIFVLVDDLGYGDLSCYGQKTVKTPNIDKLSEEGMQFSDFYAGSTVCAPSRCVLITGLHTGHCFIRGNGKDNLRPEDITIPEVLKNAGYKTALFGKWGLGHEGSEGTPLKKGFDEFFGYMDQHHAHNYYPTFLMDGEKRFPLKNIVSNEGKYGQGVASKKVEYSHDLIMGRAVKFIEENKSNPFFIYLALTLPHANNEAGNKGMEVPSLYEFADKDWPEPSKGQAAMIRHLDNDIGRLMKLLKAHGIDERTLVFFASDNGPHSEGGHKSAFFDANGQLSGEKRDLTEGGIRVPLLVRWPGKIKAGSKSGHNGGFWDVMATLADITGTEKNLPAQHDGISFANTLLNRGSQEKHDFLYWAFYERGSSQSIRMGKWKVVQQPYYTPARLYNLEDDIAEQKNLASQYPELVSKLQAKMKGAYAPSEKWKFKNKPDIKKKKKPKKK
jgi:arylsulfatase A-like enzyme